MNEDRFSGKADNYKKYRPSYAEKFIEYLYSDIGFEKESIIADIGAGTGIFSKILLDSGSFVYVVEPNSDMLDAAKQTLSNYECIYINAPAESTGLPDNSIDFVTAAQAFHWFDREKFKDECLRILKPEGKVVLTWNSRIEEAELTAENNKINQKYCIDYKGFSAGNKFVNSDEYKSYFKNTEYKEFENNLYFDLEGFTGRNLSSSYAPKPEDESYKLYIEALKELFYKFEKEGRVKVPNITASYVGKF